MDLKTRKLKEVDQYIESLPENTKEITETLRNIILDTSLELQEEYKWSMPNYSYHGLACYLQASKQHVNLGFQRGIELEGIDKLNLLNGTGKTMRHIRVNKLEEVNVELFTTYIRAAMELNERWKGILR